MKYLTKDWYIAMQRSDLHLLLKVSKQAEKFSEQLFEKLYKKKEIERLELEKSLTIFEELYPEEFPFDEDCYDSPEELEEEKEEYYKDREEARLDWEKNPPPPFDADKVKRDFKEWLPRQIQYLKAVLPQAILDKVADIRVLALDYASKTMKTEISEFCRRNEKNVNDAVKAYQKYYRETFKKNKPLFLDKFNFHDCEVKSCIKQGDDLIIKLDNSGGFTSIKKIIIKNGIIIKKKSR
jgi:hypothetical protein